MNTFIRRNLTPHEQVEGQLKSMPKEDAQKQCLQKALELSETPDKNADELLIYLRGLPMVEENGTTRVLHRILNSAKDRNLLETAIQLQSKWLSLYSEPKKDMLDDLARALKSGNAKLRKKALAALGRSKSLDALPLLLQEVEANPSDRDVLSAIGELLGWTESGISLDEVQVKSLGEQAAGLLKGLNTMRHFVSETE